MTYDHKPYKLTLFTFVFNTGQVWCQRKQKSKERLKEMSSLDEKRMSKDKTTINKVPVYSIEGLLGFKENERSSKSETCQSVIKKVGLPDLSKRSTSSASPEVEELDKNGKLNPFNIELFQH